MKPCRELEEHQKRLETLTDGLLHSYINELGVGFCSTQSKEVNDPVWQTISFSPFEVIFIDSPLVQRLRQIRQLGVVHWVYPGATHTRFEHSLGAVHQVQNLIYS